MKKLIFDIKDIAKQIGCEPELLYSEECIVDNEISNDLTPDWIYTNAKIICTGFLYQDKITILLAEEDDEKEFKETLKTSLYDFYYNYSSNVLWSFNSGMENGNFVGFVDGLFDYFDEKKASWNVFYDTKTLGLVSEIKPFRAKGWSKDRFFQTLVDHKVIPPLNIKDKFNGDGGKCIPAWDNYKKTGDFQYVMDIAQHNMNCLLKEAIINKHKKFFLDNFNVGKDGWLIVDKGVKQ